MISSTADIRSCSLGHVPCAWRNCRHWEATNGGQLINQPGSVWGIAGGCGRLWRFDPVNKPEYALCSCLTGGVGCLGGRGACRGKLLYFYSSTAGGLVHQYVNLLGLPVPIDQGA